MKFTSSMAFVKEFNIKRTRQREDHDETVLERTAESERQSKRRHLFHKLFNKMWLLVSIFLANPAFGAERISVITGAFIRTVMVEELDYLAKNGKARGFLADALRLANVEARAAQEILTKPYPMDLVQTDKLLSSDIGIAVLSRLGAVFFPPRTSAEYGAMALRSAIILSLADDGEMSPIEIIRRYPTNIWIDLDQLMALIDELDNLRDLTVQ